MQGTARTMSAFSAGDDRILTADWAKATETNAATTAKDFMADWDEN